MSKGRDPNMRRKFRAALDAVALTDPDLAADIDEWHDVCLDRQARLLERALRAEGNWTDDELAVERRARQFDEAVERVQGEVLLDREDAERIVGVLVPELLEREATS